MAVPLVFQSRLLTTLWWVTLLAVFLPETVMSIRLTSEAAAVKADRGSKLVVIVTANLVDSVGVLRFSSARCVVRKGVVRAAWLPPFLAKNARKDAAAGRLSATHVPGLQPSFRVRHADPGLRPGL